jgi:hypothetical protein
VGLQLLDGGRELGDRGRDVGQLDDVGLGRLREPAELAQGVGRALGLGEALGELGQDAGGDRDVGGGDVTPVPAVKALMIGSREKVARAGASSVKV